MDSNDPKRERGITILSKNTAITYRDTKIDIIEIFPSKTVRERRFTAGRSPRLPDSGRSRRYRSESVRP